MSVVDDSLSDKGMGSPCRIIFDNIYCFSK